MKIDVWKTEQGVNMGDHGQDVTTALDVSPDTRLGELVEKALMKDKWSARGTRRQVDTASYLVIRLADPIDKGE